MSTEKKKPGALKQIGAGLAVLAAITGIYLFQADGRKAGPSDAVAQTAAAVPQAVTRDLATGALAAFLVKSERKPVADAAFQDADGKPVKLGNFKGKVVLAAA